MQKQIDFTKPIYRRENNSISQAVLDMNETHFRGQCKIIMEAFLRGEKLTTTSALLNYKIGDLRRRIKDLKDSYNVTQIKSCLVDGRFKQWWIELQ